ncbi:MAG: hypothetical protein ACLTDV_09260 [Eubacterium sp.]
MLKRADNQPSVNWKLVSQEINEKNEYVYDGDKTDDSHVASGIAGKSVMEVGDMPRSEKGGETVSVNAANLAVLVVCKNGWVDWFDGILHRRRMASM